MQKEKFGMIAVEKLAELVTTLSAKFEEMEQKYSEQILELKEEFRRCDEDREKLRTELSAVQVQIVQQDKEIFRLTGLINGRIKK
jgi:chromosome segregation ATPase